MLRPVSRLIVVVRFLFVLRKDRQVGQVGEVVIGQAFVLNVLNNLVQGADEFAEVFFVEKNYILFLYFRPFSAFQG